MNNSTLSLDCLLSWKCTGYFYFKPWELSRFLLARDIWCFPELLSPFFELFSNSEISVKMEANNQLIESEDEPIVVTDPITVAVNSGASLSEPQGASIARNRKLPTNKGVNQQRFSAKTTKVSAWERLKEYPGQHFAVVGGKLRCNACSENLSDKKSSFDRHTKSKAWQAS